jgi:hypothetical protein
MYDWGMDTQKRELWDRLANEPERAYRAFESYRKLPSGERTLIAAYRRHVGNPDAVKPSDTWSGWSNTFAWRERAAAYDDHLASLRREAFERVIEEEAERQAREVEKVRGRYNELLTVAYERAMEWFEDSDWARSDLRASDVLKIIQLQGDAMEKLGEPEAIAAEGDWDEEDIEDEIGRQIVAEVEAEAERRRSQEDDAESEEGLPEEDKAEEA